MLHGPRRMGTMHVRAAVSVAMAASSGLMEAIMLPWGERRQASSFLHVVPHRAITVLVRGGEWWRPPYSLYLENSQFQKTSLQVLG
jgi:hypothetical protein